MRKHHSPSRSPLRRATAALGVMALAGGLMAVLAPTAATAAAPGIDVFVGYADTLRANPANFPTPWAGSPNVTFHGCPQSNCPFDAGAVRLVNNTALNETVSNVAVTIGVCTFTDATPASLAPGGQLIVTQTGNNPAFSCGPDYTNFDGSDVGPNGTNYAGSCVPDGLIPAVNVTINGTTSNFQDTGQVLNTGGIDKAVCPNPTNESNQWSLIGTSCSGATLTLAPASQSKQVGQTATLVATLDNSCGQPLQGATVNTFVAAGPNAGKSGSATTNAAGQTTFTYASAVTGTDQLLAATNNPAGTIFSNGATVTWTAPVTMTGRAYGIAATGLIKIPPTPDTGPVSTPSASTTTTPCLISVPAVIVVAHVLCANVTTALAPNSSTATASTADATVAVPGAPIVQVGVTQAKSTTTCAGSQGSSIIASLKVGATTITIPSTVPANDKIVNIPGVLTVILNEQIAAPGTLTVNAVHIIVVGTVENVIVSSATSDIHNCPIA